MPQPAPAPRLWVPWIIIPLLCLLHFGCTYIHNKERADLAKETAEDFKKFRDASPHLYQDMLQNLEKVQQAWSDRRGEIARDQMEAYCIKVSDLKWGNIKKDLEDAQKGMKERHKKIKETIENLAREVDKAAGEVGEAAKRKKTAQQLLQEATQARQQWEARQILFRRTIQFLAREAVAQDGKITPEKLEQFKKEVLDQVVDPRGATGTPAPGGGDAAPNPPGNQPGGAQNAPGVPSPQPTVGDCLGQELTALPFRDLLRKYTVNLIDPLKAPGLAVTILSLGVDLTQVQLERASLRVSYLQALIGLLENAEKLGNLPSINDALGFFPVARDLAPKEKVLQTLKKLGRQPRKEAELQLALRILMVHGLTQTLDKTAFQDMQTRPTLLSHQYSIQLSAFNAREREALISRGLEGLVAYHEGGVKPETIANLIRAAQAVALAVISAGVI